MIKMVRTLVGMVLVIVLLASCSQKGIPDAKNWPVTDFTFVDQEEKAFSLQDLQGKVWIADFIFTNCHDVCLPMTQNMSKLQKMAKEEGIKNIEFVSFSVDPTVDSPESLKNYVKQFHADLTNWHLLTGYSQEEIEKLALESFKTLVKKPEKQDQVMHGTDFYLVDQKGNVVKYYSGLNNIPYDEIINDIKLLQKAL